MKQRISNQFVRQRDAALHRNHYHVTKIEDATACLVVCSLFLTAFALDEPSQTWEHLTDSFRNHNESVRGG